MGRHSTPIKKRLSDQLPIHTPDQGLWQRISSGLDILDADKAIQQKLEHLPVHSPDKGTWMIIYTQLNRIAYYKSVARIAVAVAACLLLFFGVLQFSDNKSSTRKNGSVAQSGRALDF